MISFSTLGCPLWSLDEILATAKDLGYDGIEVRGVGREIQAPNVPEFSSINAQKTKERIASLGLSIPVLSSGAVIGVHDSAERGMREAQEHIDTAALLGVPYVRVLCEKSPQPADPVDSGLLKENYQQLLSLGAKKGVGVLLETNGIFADTSRLACFLSGIREKNAGIVYDIHHPFRYGNETPAETAQNIAGYVRHVHMKDSAIEHGQLKYRLCGYGSVPLTECVRLLTEAGYTGWFSLEWVKRWARELIEPGIAFPQYKSYMENLFKII